MRRPSTRSRCSADRTTYYLLLTTYYLLLTTYYLLLTTYYLLLTKVKMLGGPNNEP